MNTKVSGKVKRRRYSAHLYMGWDGNTKGFQGIQDSLSLNPTQGFK